MDARLQRFIRHNLSYLASNEQTWDRPSWLQIGLWVAILAATCALSLSQFNSIQLGYYGDDTYYVLLGRSLAFGNSYGLFHFPGPSQPTPWPFGFPLLLSPLIRLFPDNLDVLKLVSLGAVIVSSSLVFWGWPILSRVKSYWWALAVAALFAVSPDIITYSRSVVSEPAFIMWVLLALILVELCVRRKAHSWPLTLLLGVITMLVLFTRTIGISLVVAVFLRLVLWQPRRRALFHMIGTGAGATLFLALVLWLTPVTLNSIFPSQYVSSYQENEQLFVGTQQDTNTADNGTLNRMLRTIQLYALDIIRPTLLPVGGGESELALGGQFGIQDLPAVVSAAMTVVIVLGLLSFLWDKSLSPGVSLYIALYSGALVVWPWALARLLYPLLPFLFFGLLWGTFQISRLVLRTFTIADTRFAPLAEAVVSALFVVLLGTAIYMSQKPFDSRLYFNDFEVGADWLKQNTTPDALVMGRFPQNIYFYSERKAMDYAGVNTRASLERLLSHYAVQYVMVAPCFTTVENLTVCDPYSRDVMLPLLDEMVSAGEARLVYVASGKDDVRIFEVVASQPVSVSS